METWRVLEVLRVFVTHKNIVTCAAAATKQMRLQLLSEAVNAVNVTQWSRYRLFQTRGPATAKLLSPNWVLVDYSLYTERLSFNYSRRRE